jgi:formamidopyrimidine-DNA glycosylase
MPELAEVEFYRKRWHLAAVGDRVRQVLTHDTKKVLRHLDVPALRRALTGAGLTSSTAAAKQMLFRASGGVWLGLHLGMTGELSVQPAGYLPRKADHLVLEQSGQALIFSDFRMFGRVQFAVGPEAPVWWTEIAPAVMSKHFTRDAVATFLRRRAKSPIKAVLLMQERFPGVGNWMADEILWRAGVHPRRPAGSLTPVEVAALHRQTRWVAEHALKTIGETFADPPPSWLFRHRWKDGGRCPKTGEVLVREEIGGRTTCWSPGRQQLP